MMLIAKHPSRRPTCDGCQADGCTSDVDLTSAWLFGTLTFNTSGGVSQTGSFSHQQGAAIVFRYISRVHPVFVLRRSARPRLFVPSRGHGRSRAPGPVLRAATDPLCHLYHRLLHRGLLNHGANCGSCGSL